MNHICYLCGTGHDITRDHLPPKGFFPDPKPRNLITVPCCRKCNEGASLDDEAFRIWVTAPPDVSEAGRWVQTNKVFESTFRRSTKLVEEVKKAILESEVDGRKVDIITFPRDRAERFLVRLTKGLLAHFYPGFPSGSQTYRVLNATLCKSGWDKLAVLRDHATYGSRGSGVFQFRHRVSVEKKTGYWMFCFYEASLLMVWHQDTAYPEDLEVAKRGPDFLRTSPRHGQSGAHPPSFRLPGTGGAFEEPSSCR